MAGREFTLTELAEYDGKDGKPVYLAIRGQVFDVSEGRSFYGVFELSWACLLNVSTA